MKKFIAIAFVAVLALFSFMTFANSVDVNDNSYVVVQEETIVTSPANPPATPPAPVYKTRNNISTSTQTITIEENVKEVKDSDGNAVYREEETVVY